MEQTAYKTFHNKKTFSHDRNPNKIAKKYHNNSECYLKPMLKQKCFMCKKTNHQVEKKSKKEK